MVRVRVRVWVRLLRRASARVRLCEECAPLLHETLGLVRGRGRVRVRVRVRDRVKGRVRASYSSMRRSACRVAAEAPACACWG